MVEVPEDYDDGDDRPRGTFFVTLRGQDYEVQWKAQDIEPDTGSGSVDWDWYVSTNKPDFELTEEETALIERMVDEAIAKS